MADTHVDKFETQQYGAAAEAQLRQRVVGMQAEFDAAITWLADQMAGYTSGAAGLAGTSVALDGALQVAARSKREATAALRSVLGRFSKHLDTHPAGTVARGEWFTKDGTLKGIGAGAPKVAAAAAHIVGKLGAPDSGITNAAAWAKELGDAHAVLLPHVQKTTDARTARRGTTGELAEARRRWKRLYRAAKLVTQGLLVAQEKEALLPELFPDLAKPTRRGTGKQAPAAPAPAPSVPA